LLSSAPSLLGRLTKLQTMVFTHLPSSIALALLPVPPQLPLAIALLAIRACTQSMDSVPRSSFLSEIILPGERTAIIGTLNMAKAFAQCLSPLITGTLSGNRLFWVAFVLAGSLKVIYDFSILAVFIRVKARKDDENENETAN
jgi:sugar phosphate permease